MGIEFVNARFIWKLPSLHVAPLDSPFLMEGGLSTHYSSLLRYDASSLVQRWLNGVHGRSSLISDAFLLASTYQIHYLTHLLSLQPIIFEVWEPIKNASWDFQHEELAANLNFSRFYSPVPQWRVNFRLYIID